MEVELSKHGKNMVVAKQGDWTRRDFSEMLVPLIFDSDNADSNVIPIACTSYSCQRILYPRKISR